METSGLHGSIQLANVLPSRQHLLSSAHVLPLATSLTLFRLRRTKRHARDSCSVAAGRNRKHQRLIYAYRRECATSDPARPTVTMPAHLPPTGYLQFEQGFLQAASSPGSLGQQASLSQTTKISLTTRRGATSLHSTFYCSERQLLSGRSRQYRRSPVCRDLLVAPEPRSGFCVHPWSDLHLNAVAGNVRRKVLIAASPLG